MNQDVKKQASRDKTRDNTPAGGNDFLHMEKRSAFTRPFSVYMTQYNHNS